jgi:hypothetical protein
VGQGLIFDGLGSVVLSCRLKSTHRREMHLISLPTKQAIEIAGIFSALRANGLSRSCEKCFRGLSIPSCCPRRVLERCSANLQCLALGGVRSRRNRRAHIKQAAHHCGNDTSSQTPAATHAMPAARAIHRPIGVSFSTSTSSAKSAIQSTFITPATNKSAIKSQQQPTQ